MATTILLNIRAEAALLVQMADGSFQLMVQVADPSPYRNNPLTAYIEGETDWKSVDSNWKTASGESRAQYFGHTLDKT